MDKPTYLSRRPKLLRGFDRTLRRIRPLLVSRYGKEQALRLIGDARAEYEALIPEIPYIGDKSPFLVFLLPTVKCLALYRALQRQGGSVEEAGRLIDEMSEIELRAMPSLLRRLMGFLWFSAWFRNRARKRAISSQAREYPGNFVMEYVEGDGRSFDYGVNYLECANVKFLKAQGAEELAPYICATDKVSSEMLGWGLHRTTTLAEGADKCDFRFKRGGETSI
jgi:hypothetical protein